MSTNLKLNINVDILLPCYSFIFLFLENYGVRKLEAFFAVLIAIMAVSFAAMFGEAKPNGKELLLGKEFISLIWTCANFSLL